ITRRLEAGAVGEYLRRFSESGRLVVAEAPGAFELPTLAHAAAASGHFDAVVCLGCVIKGETSHDVYISHAISHAIAMIPLQTGVPVAFGVLTVDTPEQAVDRAGGVHGNKGEEAMIAALETLAAAAALRQGFPYSLGCRPQDKAQAPSS
ncbi:MAG: 6,7-dimethyl-8-ribityllumazine synthase, partial [Phycisphaerales bacterium]